MVDVELLLWCPARSGGPEHHGVISTTQSKRCHLWLLS